MSYDSFPIFQDNRAACCDRIRSVEAFVKIILITKDDRFFIDRWIAHHLKIAGPEGLIVFDNMSSDPEVLAVYEKYRGRINIMRFAGQHSKVHHARAYRDLYKAIAESSEFSIFIDTDEYLVMIEGDRYYDDGRILNFIKDNSNYGMFPATWLLNANWSDTQFIGIQANHLATFLANGKPLVRSDVLPTGYVNHCFQLGTQLFTPPFKTNLFLLHFSRLFSRQRIASNVNKLIARGLVRPGETVESIAARDDIVHEIAALYVREIRECLHFERNGKSANSVLGWNSLELLPDGTVSYSSEVEKKLLDDFLKDPQSFYDLIPDQFRLGSIIDGAGRVIDG